MKSGTSASATPVSGQCAATVATPKLEVVGCDSQSVRAKSGGAPLQDVGGVSETNGIASSQSRAEMCYVTRRRPAQSLEQLS